MSAQQMKANQPLNRREVYKNQKLEQLNEIYYCECGKNYLTFSALYLHARNKHQIKLTTKRNDSLCKVEKKEQKTIVTYFIAPKNQQTEFEQQQVIQKQNTESFQNSEESDHSLHQIIEIVDEYLNQAKEPHSNNFNNTTKAISEFKKYLQKLGTINCGQIPTEPCCIPYFFNDFIVCYLPECHRQGNISISTLGLAEISMIKFWRWLRQKKITTSQLLHKSNLPLFK